MLSYYRSNIAYSFLEGISFADYTGAVRGEKELQFLCVDCCTNIFGLEPENVKAFVASLSFSNARIHKSIREYSSLKGEIGGGEAETEAS